jgi:hypothetical protein
MLRKPRNLACKNSPQGAGLRVGAADLAPMGLTLSLTKQALRRELEQRSEELSEMRRIVAALVQRVPELEPAREATPEPRDGDVSASEGMGNGEAPPEQEKRSWWRRLFSG